MLLASSGAFADETKHAFNIPAENTAKALNDFSKQSGIQILYPYDIATQSTAPAIKGTYSSREALGRILVGSGLEVASEVNGTITLRVAKNAEPVAATEPPTEVIVTGSHIRGGNSTSPVHTVTRKDIEQSGYSTIGDVMRSLPENFAGGQNPGVIGASSGNTSNTNLTGASAINLRGLGSDATLLLVNGHRMASDGNSQAADISGVPLAAVQRIEVVPDGASALYGSDAVAGVVNVVLKKTYTGAEVTAIGGVSSQGAGTNRQISALVGHHGANWYALANLEIQNQDAVYARDRERTAQVAPQTTLLPSASRKTLFVSGGWDINDWLSLSADGLLNERGMYQILKLSPTSAEQQYTNTTPAFSAAINLDARLGGDWKLHVVDVMSAGRTSFHIYFPDYNSVSTGLYRNSLESLEATADGTAFSLPSGPVKVAVGGGTRTETYNRPAPKSRQVNYAFGEALVPLVTPSSDRVGLQELEINLSARAEHYSTFGDTVNPRVGLRYVPAGGLTVRASWGKSFKAPSFLQMYANRNAFLVDSSLIGYGNSGVVLVTLGGNPDLKPEKSTSWTLGAEYVPTWGKGLSLSVNYFDIDFTGRVVQPASVIVGALSTDKYAPFVEATPSAATQSQVIANADVFANLSSGPYDPTKVVALFRDQLTNTASQAERGIDLGYRQAFRFSAGTVSTFANATFLELNQRFIPSSPDLALSGTVFNVPKAKVRGGASFERGDFSVTLIGNYVSSETDNGLTPSRAVGSWTTADLTTTYAFKSGAAKGVRIGLSITNLFDRAPPVTYSSAIVYGGLNYDSTNASILGRYTALSLSKAW